MQHTVYLFDGFQLDVTRRKLVSSGGLVQPLNSRAMEALLLLVSKAGELVEKRRLMQTVWPDAIVEENNLNQCVLAIRKALGETAGSNRYIMTIPGRGYRFVSPVRTVVQESGADAAIVVARRSPQTLWLSIAAAGGALLLAMLLLRIAQGPANSGTSAVEEAAAASETSPIIVLRLHEPAATTGAAAATSATALLVQCLAAQPGMKLRVQVQLVNDGGVPAWTGQYIAGAQDLLVLQTSGTAVAACHEPGSAARSDQKGMPTHALR